MENKNIQGYKGFEKDMTCRGFQYEEGGEYDINSAKTCKCGFHYCEHPLRVLRYYPPATSIYHEVEGSGNMDKGDDKIACTHIKIGARMDIAGLVKAAISYVKSRCTNEHNTEPGQPAAAGSCGAATAGNHGAATAGDSGAATAGNCGAATAGSCGAATAGNHGAATAGDSGAATAGDSGAATAGDYGAATAGYCGAATAGNCGAATSMGSAIVGENGIACVRGNHCRVKGGMGALLVIADEYEDNYAVKAWKAVVVDGITIKADTWYRLNKLGELIEE